MNRKKTKRAITFFTIAIFYLLVLYLSFIPNKETIRKEIRSLHPHPRYMEPDHKEGAEDTITLVIRRTTKARGKLIDDFLAVLGKPVSLLEQNKKFTNPVTVYWKI